MLRGNGTYVACAFRDGDSAKRRTAVAARIERGTTAHLRQMYRERNAVLTQVGRRRKYRYESKVPHRVVCDQVPAPVAETGGFVALENQQMGLVIPVLDFFFKYRKRRHWVVFFLLLVWRLHHDNALPHRRNEQAHNIIC